MTETKKQLRSAMKAKQKAMEREYVDRASESIQRQVIASDAFRRAGSVFVYIHTPEEPATDRIIRAALDAGKRVYVPRCVDKTTMLAVRIRDPGELVPGMFGIPEPADLTETADARSLDLMLVPCLSASADGRRLGRGAGYYDRFLAQRPHSAVCLCFRRMLCGEIPMEPTDVLMGSVITDEESQQGGT